MAINTIANLRTHLQWAIQVELTTIPTYLYALFSIKDRRSQAANVFRGIVIEEMLHVALASNLMVSVGGRPRFYDRNIVPRYPGPVPHHTPGFTVNLERCSVDFVRDTCMAIEKPEEPSAPPEDDNFETIGQFYMSVEAGLKTLSQQLGDQLFGANVPARQLSEGYFPEISDTGDLKIVTDLESALAAIQIIIEQGEGILGSHYDDVSKQELAHYYKFERIVEGEAPLGDVWPVAKNPHTSDLSGPIRNLSDFFNGCFCYMLLAMEEIFSITDQTRKHEIVFRGLFSIMSAVLPQLARTMMSQPISEGASENGGPTFEYIEFQRNVSVQSQLVALCERACSSDAGLDRITRIVSTLPDLNRV